MTSSADLAMATWHRGHHAFFVLTQGLVVAFALAAEALRQSRWDEARERLKLATTLLDASGATMELAGEISTEDYTEVIRPSMQQPALPLALSGLMSADHAALMRQLGGLRALLEAYGEHLEPTVTGLRRALAVLYDRHIHVCERFVDGPSLRGGNEGPSAVQALGRIKACRLRNLPHELPDRATPAEHPAGATPSRCPFGAMRSADKNP